MSNPQYEKLEVHLRKRQYYRILRKCTDNMVSLSDCLSVALQMIEWNPSIPEQARQEASKRLSKGNARDRRQALDTLEGLQPANTPKEEPYEASFEIFGKIFK